MAAVYFAALGQAPEKKAALFSTRPSATRGIRGFRFRSPNLISRAAVCSAATPPDVPPTVAETKLNFWKSYKRPIPSIYNNVLQELLVQQHLMRYKRTYQYDAVFALGFVTIYEQLMEGYPSLEDQDAIFRAYIVSLREDPEQYRFFILGLDHLDYAIILHSIRCMNYSGFSFYYLTNSFFRKFLQMRKECSIELLIMNGTSLN